MKHIVRILETLCGLQPDPFTDGLFEIGVWAVFIVAATGAWLLIRMLRRLA